MGRKDRLLARRPDCTKNARSQNDPSEQLAHHGGLSDALHPLTQQPANCNKQQDLSEKDGGSLLSVPRRCSQEKRMREESQSSGTALCCYSHFVQYFPFRPPRARSRPSGRNMDQDHLSLRSLPPVFPGALTEVFGWMWPIREIRIRDSVEGKSRKRARRGRTHLRTGRSV